MTDGTGWILDVSILDRAIIWIKTTEGRILKLTDAYQPNFYILPKDELAGAELFQILSQEPIAGKVEWEYKFTDLFNPENRGFKKLISVYSKTTFSHKILQRRLENDTRVAQLFNIDLSYVQRYLFTTLKVEPSRKVEVEYDKDTSQLIRITSINEDEIAPPPFSILYFDILNSDGNQVRQIRARQQGEQDVSFDGEEEWLLKEFCDYVVAKDPDIIVSTSPRFEDTAIDCLFKGLDALGLDLGREPSIYGHTRINGRVYLRNTSFHSDLDLTGLIEKARFGFLPLTTAARFGMNRLIDSRNCYELIQKGFAIPGREYGRYEPIRTLEEINLKDKGGMIFSPRVGLHENVVVLDYENEYANLIIRHNLSYETYRGSEEQGLLPTRLERVLSRRIFFRNLQKSFSLDTNEWSWCEQRIDTLKSILVSLCGTSGSFWNRFANVRAFEEINRLSRQVLIKTKDIVQAHGFELLYADTDSVSLKKDGAHPEDFEYLREILARETGLPISLEYYYRFLVLLPLEASEKMEALKHYFGITQSGELIARGIEIRRHDAPNFIKEFQTELLYTLFDCKDSVEVMSKGFEKALLLVTRMIDKVMTGDLKLQDLVVTKLLGQGLDKYKSLFPHVSAAIQLAIEGKSTSVGEGVEYVFTNARHTNPLNRVTPRELIKERQDLEYDKEKYREMLLEAAETILGYFGFDRTDYGVLPKRNRRWWHGLRDERRRDIDTETKRNT